MNEDKKVTFGEAIHHWVGLVVTGWLCWWLLSERMKPPQCSWLLPGSWFLPASLLCLLLIIQLIATLNGGRLGKAKASVFLISFWLAVATVVAVQMFAPKGSTCAGHAGAEQGYSGSYIRG